MMRALSLLGDWLRLHHRRRHWSADRAAGRLGEDLAHRYLERQGFIVVARNYVHSSGRGELDLVAWEGETLAFVEVKSRATDEFRAPESAVDAAKQGHVVRVARDFARRAGAEWDSVRFDIVSVLLGNPPRIELQRNAFHPRR